MRRRRAACGTACDWASTGTAVTRSTRSTRRSSVCRCLPRCAAAARRAGRSGRHRAAGGGHARRDRRVHRARRARGRRLQFRLGRGGRRKARRARASSNACVAGGAMRVLGPNCIGVGGAAARYCVAYNSSFEHIALPPSAADRRGVPERRDARRPAAQRRGCGHRRRGLRPRGQRHRHRARGGRGASARAPRASETLALLIEGLHEPARVRRAGAAARARSASASRCSRRGARRSAACGALAHRRAGRLGRRLRCGLPRRGRDCASSEPEDLLPVARMLALAHRPAGRRVLVYTLSGGGASVLADELAREALAIPDTGRIDPCTVRCAGQPVHPGREPVRCRQQRVLRSGRAESGAGHCGARSEHRCGVLDRRRRAARRALESAARGGARASWRDAASRRSSLPMSGTVAEPGFRAGACARCASRAQCSVRRAADVARRCALAPARVAQIDCCRRQAHRPNKVLGETDAKRELAATRPLDARVHVRRRTWKRVRDQARGGRSFRSWSRASRQASRTRASAGSWLLTCAAADEAEVAARAMRDRATPIA